MKIFRTHITQHICSPAIRRAIFYTILAMYWGILGEYRPFAAQPHSRDLTIAIIQPRSIAAYQQAMEGFLETLRKNSLPRFNTITYETPQGLYTTLRQHKVNPENTPIDLIVSVGTNATAEVSKNVHHVPIIFSMVLNPENVLSGRTDIIGSTLNISVEFQLKMVREVLPAIESLGIIYDPKRNQKLLEAFIALAPQFHLKIEGVPVSSQKDIPKALSQVNARADALLGIVDNTVYTSRTTAFIIRYTVKEQLPFIGLSPSYVKAGALCSLVFDNHDIGRQTAELAKQLLSGVPASTLQNTVPEKINIAINLRTADIIGIRIPKKIQKNASIVYE